MIDQGHSLGEWTKHGIANASAKFDYLLHFLKLLIDLFVSSVESNNAKIWYVHESTYSITHDYLNGFIYMFEYEIYWMLVLRKYCRNMYHEVKFN